MKNCEHCLHETCRDAKCEGNHTLHGHTPECVMPYFVCCICWKRFEMKVSMEPIPEMFQLKYRTLSELKRRVKVLES